MSTKHTPGPWEIGQIIEGINYNASNIYSGTGMKATAICQTYGMPLHTGLERFDDKEFNGRFATGLANARLIAAAPDLLEACRSLVFAEQCSEKSLAAAIYKARRAIAKAEGK